jgi:hypothetical protein
MHPADITTFFPMATLLPILAVSSIAAEASIPAKGNCGVKYFLITEKKAFSGDSTTI